MKPATHERLTTKRHAELVAYLCRQNITAYRVLFMPVIYLFDPCEICPTLAGKYAHDNCGLTLDIEMDQLRIAFMHVKEWDAAMRIIRSLVDKDRKARAMSIGVKFGDRVIMGEAI